MKQFDMDVEGVIRKAVGQHTTSIGFEEVWDAGDKKNRKAFKIKNAIKVPLVAILTLLVLFTVGMASSTIKNIDKTDYPFVDDPAILGKWDAVDFVSNMDDFVPEKKTWTSELFLNSYVFIKQGKMLAALENENLADIPSTWTKGMVLNKQDNTTSKYVIKEINGITYMFCEWKSGDYVFLNRKPSYYVLKKVDNEDYSSYQIKAIRRDNIDYPFIDDEKMKGKWESVDFVQHIESFKPGVRSWLDDDFLKELSFEDNGKLKITTSSEFSNDNITWTKGMIIDKIDCTASKCEIKEIEGSVYMFREWKTGDYIYRGREPYYYVLKKVQN